MKDKLVLIIVFVFLIITTASAQVEDFGIVGDEVIDAFRCTSTKSSFKIINTGDLLSNYFLSIDGGAAEWAEVTPGGFSLNPKEELLVNIQLDVPCEAQVRKHNLLVYIETASGLQDIFEIDVFVENPTNAEVDVKEFFKTIYPCTEAVFNFTVKNPFDFQEKYALSTDKFQEESVLSYKRFVLEPFKSKDVTLKLSIKDCKLTGTFPITLSVKTEKTRLTVETELELEITSNGIIEIAKGIDRIKANLSESFAEIPLENKGDESTAYSFSLEGPEWVSLDKKSLTIEAGEIEKIRIITNPSQDVNSGDYQVTIKAKVDKTGAEYSKKLTIRLVKPTFLDKLATQYTSYFVAGIVALIVIIIVVLMIVKKVTSEEYKKRRALRKKEKERLKEKKKKETERLKEKREEEKLEREREIEKIKKLREAELKKEFAFVPKKIEKEKKISGKGFLRFLLWIILIAVLIVGYHFKGLIKENLTYFVGGVAILIILYIIDRLLSGFSRTARFKKVVANRKNEFNIGWKKGLGQVSVSLNSPVKKLKLRFRRGRQRRAYSAPGELAYQYFIGFSNVADENIKEANLMFKVKKSWLKRNNIFPSDVKLLNYVDGRWKGIETVITGNDKKYEYYKTTASNLGQFAIVGKSRKEKTVRKRTGLFVGLVLIIIAIIIAAYLPTALKKPTVVKGIPPQIWTQGTTHNLDLTQYFKDPEGRTLRFEASDVASIDIWISSDGIATFTPDFGFYDERTVVFTAFDEQGLEVSSNNIKLVVTKALLPLSIRLSIRQHLGFILAGVIIVIFVVLLIVYREPLRKFVMEE